MLRPQVHEAIIARSRGLTRTRRQESDVRRRYYRTTNAAPLLAHRASRTVAAAPRPPHRDGGSRPGMLRLASRRRAAAVMSPARTIRRYLETTGHFT